MTAETWAPAAASYACLPARMDSQRIKGHMSNMVSRGQFVRMISVNKDTISLS